MKKNALKKYQNLKPGDVFYMIDNCNEKKPKKIPIRVTEKTDLGDDKTGYVTEDGITVFYQCDCLRTFRFRFTVLKDFINVKNENQFYYLSLE